MAINYARNLKNIDLPSKNDFETSSEYENRVSSIRQENEKNAINYDANLLLAAMNASTCTMVMSRDFNYEYDADSQLMSIAFNDSEDNYLEEVKVKFKIDPIMAKRIVDEYSNYAMAKVFELNKQHKLIFTGVFFFHTWKMTGIKDETDNPYLTEMLIPVSYEQRYASNSELNDRQDGIYEVRELIKKKPFISVKNNYTNDYIFGLENYLPPEEILNSIKK